MFSDRLQRRRAAFALLGILSAIGLSCFAARLSFVRPGEETVFAVLLSIVLSVSVLAGFRLVLAGGNGVLSRVGKTDWVLLAAVALFAAYLFNGGYDLQITIMHSKALLEATGQGDLLKFYTFVYNRAISGAYIHGSAVDGANYNILVYLALGLAIAPIWLAERVLGISVSEYFYLIYLKTLILGAYWWAGKVVRDFARSIGLSEGQAGLAMFLFLSSPILLMGNLAFGQFDFLSTALFIIALQFYIKRQYFSFSAIASLSIAIKSFPVVAFVPLVLLAEKRLTRILAYLFVGASAAVITRLLFGADPGYGLTKSFMSAHYGFIDRLFAEKIGSVSIVIAAFVALCVYAYALNPPASKSELCAYAVHLPLASFAVLFSWIFWHPQWLAHISPFIALSVVLSRKKRLSMLLSLSLSISYLLTTTIRFPQNVDNYAINGGALPQLLGRVYAGPTLSSAVAMLPHAGELMASIFACVMLCNAFYGLRTCRAPVEPALEEGIDIGLTYLHLATVAGYFVISTALYFLFP